MAELISLAPAHGLLTRHVIFVHGLGGDPRGTWTSLPPPPPQNRIWPTWLAEDLEGLAVWSVGSLEDDPVHWAAAHCSLGSALGALGGTEHLQEAAAAFQQSLKVWKRDLTPNEWASAQLGLGMSLKTLGGTADLEKAVVAFRAVSRSLRRLPCRRRSATVPVVVLVVGGPPTGPWQAVKAEAAKRGAR